jgi:hypothetical protein
MAVYGGKYTPRVRLSNNILSNSVIAKAQRKGHPQVLFNPHPNTQHTLKTHHGRTVPGRSLLRGRRH